MTGIHRISLHIDDGRGSSGSRPFNRLINGQLFCKLRQDGGGCYVGQWLCTWNSRRQFERKGNYGRKYGTLSKKCLTVYGEETGQLTVNCMERSPSGGTLLISLPSMVTSCLIFCYIAVAHCFYRPQGRWSTVRK